MDLINIWRRILIPENGYSLQDIWQLAAVALLLIITSRLFKNSGDKKTKRNGPIIWLKHNRGFLILWGIVIVTYLVCSSMAIAVPVFRLFTYLGGAWTIIGLITSFYRERFWAESVAAVCYLGAAFSVLALAGQSVRFLEDVRFSIGAFHFSVWSILSGIVALLFTFWISLALSRQLVKQVNKSSRLTASLKVLSAKLIYFIILATATYIALDSMDVDLSAFAVLSGAIGLGLGFGLQKVISNFISGIILLLDNSIKPGDVIEIEGTYGWINNLKARYASVITRDGTEHLIPNEDLITQRVINWSFSNTLVRLKVPIGVSYKSDIHQCIQLVLDAASSIDRVLKDPAPTCPLRGFGDSSVDLELRFWVSDPSNGVANVQSLVLLKIWDSFKEHNIEIPFPQRDLHIRSSEVMTVPRSNPDPE
jgi:small-conductance mechanosensitive channel